MNTEFCVQLVFTSSIQLHTVALQVLSTNQRAHCKKTGKCVFLSEFINVGFTKLHIFSFMQKTYLKIVRKLLSCWIRPRGHIYKLNFLWLSYRSNTKLFTLRLPQSYISKNVPSQNNIWPYLIQDINYIYSDLFETTTTTHSHSTVNILDRFCIFN